MDLAICTITCYCEYIVEQLGQRPEAIRLGESKKECHFFLGIKYFEKKIIHSYKVINFNQRSVKLIILYYSCLKSYLLLFKRPKLRRTTQKVHGGFR